MLYSLQTTSVKGLKKMHNLHDNVLLRHSKLGQRSEFWTP
jgi:hypothetical protein